MGQYPAHYRVPGTQSHNPEHHRQQAERLCTQQQNQTRPLGVRQPHPESLSTELYRLCILTPKRAAGRKPWGKLSPAASHANCIIFYNATLLSKLLAHKESRGDMQGAALVKQVSPVAWQHINLYGRYEFRKRPEPVDVDEIVRELAEIRIGTEPALAA